MDKMPNNFRIQAFKNILTDLDNWINSALEDINVYLAIHEETKVSKLTSVEFIQRALEKGVKISSHLFSLILIFSDSNYPYPFSTLLSKNEVQESLNKEFIQRTSKFFTSVYDLRDPTSMRHTPCKVLIEEVRQSLPSQEYVELSRSREKEVMDALIEINVVSKGDAEVYFDYAKALRNYQTALLNVGSNKNDSFKDVTSKVARLKELRPRDDFGFLVYSVLLLSLAHTTLGRLALFTPMKTFEKDIREIDTMLSELHNELARSKMNSELYRNLNGIMSGLITISTYFPLCQYLGTNYTKLKYPIDSKDSKRTTRKFDVTGIIESDSFFASVSADLRKALSDILSWSKFFRCYVFGNEEKK